jgi:hypothetical protein
MAVIVGKSDKVKEEIRLKEIILELVLELG